MAKQLKNPLLAAALRLSVCGCAVVDLEDSLKFCSIPHPLPPKSLLSRGESVILDLEVWRFRLFLSVSLRVHSIYLAVFDQEILAVSVLRKKVKKQKLFVV